MPARTARLLMASGEMGRQVKAHDWSRTNVGAIEQWSDDLQMAVGLCLVAPSPMMLVWGPTWEFFYNDGAISLLGPKHPHAALGLPLEQVYPEVWEFLEPLYTNIWTTGQPYFLDEQRLLIRRTVPQQEIYISVSYTPIFLANGDVGGIHLVCNETTSAVLAARRTAMLQACAIRATGAQNAEDAYKRCLDCFGESPRDILAGVLYRIESEGASAVPIETVGIQSAIFAPGSVSLQAAAGRTLTKALRAAQQTGSPAVLPDVESYLQGLQPISDVAPHAGVVIPLGVETDEFRTFLLVVASPLQPLDANYLGFFSLLANIMANSGATADALSQQMRRVEQLAALDRTKSAFFSNVSHELRTPLTLMLGHTEQALNDERLLDCDVLQTLHRNQLRLLKLVNSLLDFSALEAGRTEADLRPVDLSRLTAGLASGFEIFTAQTGLRLLVDCPPSPGPVMVDSGMWEKIVLNLLSNAFKYTLEGEVRVALTYAEDSVQLTVSDTGQGIAPAELSKLFERFQRGENVRGRSHEGTGLGLALVKEFTELQGGSVNVASAVGSGSRFIVQLPRRKIPEERAAPPTPLGESAQKVRVSTFVAEVANWNAPRKAAPAADEAPSSGEKPCIVVADDNADMRAYIGQLLRRDYDVVVVANGTEALEAIRRRRPNLLLSDVMMPHLDGFELLRTLRADPQLRTLPVILLSARAGEEGRTGGFELAADDYLTKPFVAKELLARIRSQLAMVRVRQQVAVQETSMALLAEQQAWLRSLLNFVPVPLFLIEPGTSHITFSNQAAQTIVGKPLPTDALLATVTHSHLMRSEMNLPFEEGAHPVWRSARGETFRDEEVIWETPVGTFHLLVDSQPIDAPGQPPSMLICMRDISRIKAIQYDLRKLLRSRDEFLCLASHELKTPLTSLTLQTQMAVRKLRRGAAVVPPVSTLLKLFLQTNVQLQRLTRLVDDMLDTGRIDTGKLTLRREDCDLSRLVHEVVERLCEQLETVPCPIEIDAAKPVHGLWDRFRIEQVLTNLLTNAARYGVGKPIKIVVTQCAGWAELSVADQGRGIAVEDRERIFERFERAVSGSEVSGLGLGLFIVKQIVEAHGGSARVANAPLGWASKFVVRLPVRAA